MRHGLRRAALRTVWLLVGAAIGLAALLLLISLAQVLAQQTGAPSGPWTAGCLVPALLIGLLPGTRELEVTSARTLLGVTSDLVQPARPRPEHRWRTMVTVVLHLVAGLLAAAFLFALLPGTVLLVASSLQDRSEVLAGVRVPPAPPAVAVGLGVLAAVGSLAGTYALGRWSAWCTARLLGPTAQDRLEVALSRLQAESEHTRLARELHDGIGHALTIIGVQAAAGRRVLARDPEQAGAALGSIESTSRDALEELDAMLGLLRDGAAERAPEPDLGRLPVLLSAYRSAGMELHADLGRDLALPRLVSSTGYRIVSEALANAQRYAGPGPVQLQLERGRDRLVVEVANLLPTRPLPRQGSGRGLTGIAERVALFGGTVSAGPVDTRWVLRADIPTGAGRE